MDSYHYKGARNCYYQKIPPFKQIKWCSLSEQELVDVEEKVASGKPVYFFNNRKKYYLNDLVNYERSVKLCDIGGPFQERPIIDNLINELNMPYSPLSCIKPLEDLICTSTPGDSPYEIDFMQAAVILPVCKVGTIRYEVKDCFKDVNHIREQFETTRGVYNVLVENELASPEKIAKRFKLLYDELSDLALAFIITDGSYYNVFFNFGMVYNKPDEFYKIMAYKFDNVIERDLMITAYSLFSNLGYINNNAKRLVFDDGVLYGTNSLTISTKPIGGDHNHVLIYNPFNTYLDDVIHYRSPISRSLGDCSTVSVSYKPPLADTAKLSILIDPEAPSRYVINSFNVDRDYLSRLKLSFLSSKFKITHSGFE